MNKAFLREVDATFERCPACSAVGIPVGPDTVAAWLKPDCALQFRDGVHFCPFPTCDVVYFDAFERFVRTAEMQAPVYPKDATAPVCGCFGFDFSDVDEDLAEGTLVRTKALAQRIKSGENRCRTQSPSGQCCLEEVQRYYFRHRPAP